MIVAPSVRILSKVKRSIHFRLCPWFARSFRAAMRAACPPSPPSPTPIYDAARLRNASATSDAVVHLDWVQRLELPSGELGALLTNCRPYGNGVEPRAFNPSIVAAPSGLCARCRYVVAVRASTRHQCDADGELSRRRRRRDFAATAILVLDASLRRVASTWLLNAVDVQLRPSDGAFEPSRNRVHDVRLHKHDGQLLMTSHCHKCRFRISLLHLRLTEEPTGARLHAWSSIRDHAIFGSAWLQGRNQALISAAAAAGGSVGRPILLLQPWIDLVVALTERPTGVRFVSRKVADPFAKAAQRSARRRAPRLTLHAFSDHYGGNEGSGDHLGVLYNHSAERLREQLLRRGGTAPSRLRPLLSATAHTIHVSRPAGQRRCEAILGIGHVHGPPSSAFRFGAQYAHAFYTLSPRPPHRMLAASSDFFCLASLRSAGHLAEHAGAASGAECEAVQYVSGLALEEPALGAETTDGPPGGAEAGVEESQNLLLSYGVNDCEAVLGRIAMRRVWQAMKPVEGSSDACEII